MLYGFNNLAESILKGISKTELLKMCMVTFGLSRNCINYFLNIMSQNYEKN